MNDQLDIPDFDPTPAWARGLFHVLVGLFGLAFMGFAVARYWLLDANGCYGSAGACDRLPLMSMDAIGIFWAPALFGLTLILYLLRKLFKA
jgi:hypothetical protein